MQEHNKVSRELKLPYNCVDQDTHEVTAVLVSIMSMMHEPPQLPHMQQLKVQRVHKACKSASTTAL